MDVNEASLSKQGKVRNVILHVVTVGRRKAADWPRLDHLRFVNVQDSQ